MAGLLFCSFCAENLTKDTLLDHIERIHAGTREETLYALCCGKCEYRTSELKKIDMIEHCFKMKHSFINVQLDWNGFVERETSRIKHVIGSGVELLEENRSDNQPPSGQMAISPSSRDSNDDSSDESYSYPQIDHGMKEEYQKSMDPFVNPQTPEQKEYVPKTSEESNESNMQNEGSFRDGVNPKHTNKSFEAKVQPSVDYSTKEKMSPQHSKRIEKMIHHDPKVLSRTKNYYRMCQHCRREISTRKNQFNNMYLMAHTITHTDLKFLECLDCAKETNTRLHTSDHMKKRGCRSGVRGTMTEEKRSALREMLNRCFPGVDFEMALSSSSTIGNSKKESRGLNPLYGFKKRSQPAGEWDCAMCPRSRVNGPAAAVSHTIFHSGLKPYQCTSCLTSLSDTMLSKHRRSCKSQVHGFSKGYQVILSEENRKRITQLLWRAFPLIKWDEKLKSGRKLAGIIF